MNCVKNSAAMAGAIWVIACMVTPSRWSGRRPVSPGQPRPGLRIMGCVRPVLRLPEVPDVPDVPDLSLFPPSAAIAGDDLHVGGCSLREMAERFGTPAYVIDEQA